ncbi:hypothetical protein BACCELL_02801 [Bacteroides cellulosilyticus DSM 14838]|uniref:Uncharacterized protein n=1 Tax=Bacteroides cellulosilyticus DSM 14838 TaxID=537012 RepID=E2NET2_9BACE|nr:hypothetical protein BACCELL_02801 [Bacteroides cellulosilyticus DSM 14838]
MIFIFMLRLNPELPYAYFALLILLIRIRINCTHSNLKLCRYNSFYLKESVSLIL